MKDIERCMLTKNKYQEKMLAISYGFLSCKIKDGVSEMEASVYSTSYDAIFQY